MKPFEAGNENRDDPLLNSEDREEREAQEKDIDENGERGGDDEDGFVEMLQTMSEEEREQWEVEVEPVRRALWKVSLFALFISEAHRPGGLCA